MKRLIVIAIFFSVAMINVGRAELTVNDFIQQQTYPNTGVRKLGQVYISGLINGFLWYRAVQGTMDPNAPILYCQPEKLILRPEQAISILKQFRDTHPDKGGMSLAQGLLGALGDTFPCK